MQRTLSKEQYLQVVGRCASDGNVQTQDAQSICQLHHDRWLQHYKPTTCAACPNPLSISASRPCPEWMREQLITHHGTFVHVRPCYLEAVRAKKQRAANSEPMEVEKENEQPKQTFHIDVSQHNIHTYNYCYACTHTHKYVLCLPVCAGRLGWRNPLEHTFGTRPFTRAD